MKHIEAITQILLSVLLLTLICTTYSEPEHLLNWVNKCSLVLMLDSSHIALEISDKPKLVLNLFCLSHDMSSLWHTPSGEIYQRSETTLKKRKKEKDTVKYVGK